MFDSELIPQLSDREIEALTVAEAAAWDDAASDRQMIPDRLDEWSPGPFLAAVLPSIDPSRLNGHDTVVLMKAHARQVAHDQAGYYSSVAEVATAIPTDEEGPPERTEEWFEYASMEVRAALTLTRRAADSELDFAYDLVERLPSVLKALDSGTIDLRKAREIARGTGHLDQGTAMAVADRVLRNAARLTTGQLRVRLQRLCIEGNPEDARQRSENAIDDRRLIIEPTVDGTAEFRGYGAAIDRAAAIGRKVNGLARNLKTADEPRTIDQLRMDVFLDLLEGGHSGSVRPDRGTVGIHVDLETLAELSEAPGELAGYGYVIADVARQVAKAQTDSEWQIIVTDQPGDIVHTGTTRRRPTVSQKRRILANYPTCVFPGCRMPASQCDIDHTTPWSHGGETSVENNAPLCRHDHVGRHKAGWVYVRLADGQHQWTSPHGHTYVTTADRPP